MCDLPEFFIDQERTCRKDTKCVECGGQIHRGTRYRALTGKWDGQVETYKCHSKCYELATAAREYFKQAGLYDDELPAIGYLVEATQEEANGCDDFPQYWPKGVYISKKALREYIAIE